MAPRMLKISMTDGTTTCHAVEIESWQKVSLNTPPGTKIRLKGNKIPVSNSFLKITNANIEVLGGQVQHLVEKWTISQSLAEFSRSEVKSGAPKWLKFGQKLAWADPNDKDFKALARNENEDSKENEEFDSQRKEAIEEAAKVEQKKFGGGKGEIAESSQRFKRERMNKSESCLLYTSPSPRDS